MGTICIYNFCILFLLTNLNTIILEKLKSVIQNYYYKKLQNITFNFTMEIIDLNKQFVSFIGFEIKRNKKILVFPDKEMLLMRLHCSGYCESSGFPREIPKLSSLKEFEIINKYNYLLTGLVTYYFKYLQKPKYNLSRWIYIIRYSCFKTFAQKLKSTIQKVLKNYSVNTNYKKKYKTNTIEYSLQEKLKKRVFLKTWILKTLNELVLEFY